MFRGREVFHNKMTKPAWHFMVPRRKSRRVRQSPRCSCPGNRRPSTHFARDDPEPGLWLGRGPRRGVEECLIAMLVWLRGSAVQSSCKPIGASLRSRAGLPIGYGGGLLYRRFFLKASVFVFGETYLKRTSQSSSSLPDRLELHA